MRRLLIGIAAVIVILKLEMPNLVAAADVATTLASTGTLRATFLGGNPVQGRVNPDTGAINGPVADIVRELARKLSVPYTITPGANVKAVMESVKANTADIGFLAFDPTRASEVDFSEPYSIAFNTYLVPAASPIHSIADIDKPGLRILAPQGDSGELFLRRTLKHADLKGVAGATAEDAQKMFAAAEIDAFATNRQRLVEASARIPNVRVLPDNFFGVEQSLILAKGDLARIDFINHFIDDLRSSGFLQAALTRAGLNGVEVAPARKQ